MPPANPLGPPSSPGPSVSLTTLQITGLLVDVYGLAELAPTATRVTCLWLHHPRSRRKEDMADFARRAVSAFNRSSAAAAAAAAGRGLIALAFDQRNHGSRAVDEGANGSWREGNPRHAQDMFGVVAGTAADQERLIDAVAGYLFVGGVGERTIDGHVLLGVSLGGHSVWQTMFLDGRVKAGVVIIGCPDFECEYLNLAYLLLPLFPGDWLDCSRGGGC